MKIPVFMTRRWHIYYTCQTCGEEFEIGDDGEIPERDPVWTCQRCGGERCEYCESYPCESCGKIVCAVCAVQCCDGAWYCGPFNNADSCASKARRQWQQDDGLGECSDCGGHVCAGCAYLISGKYYCEVCGGKRKTSYATAA